MNRRYLLTLLISIFIGNAIAQSSGTSETKNVTVTGELKKWHTVTLTFDGPECSETDEYNPFFNYRLNVTFTHEKSGKSYKVPGYFAADGNAGMTSATSGNKWRVHSHQMKLASGIIRSILKKGNGLLSGHELMKESQQEDIWME